jgi:NarL family two-component system sensor histidine kinase LiaS
MANLLRSIKNMKWELLVYFLIVSETAIGIVLLGLYYLPMLIQSPWIIWTIIAICVLIEGFIIGYVVAVRFQRKVNLLHLSILQLSRGNLTTRIPLTGNDTFDKIYYDFNDMSASIEKRIQLLQKLGEENVRLQVSSNEAAVLEERKRLARDLHDTVSQQLFALHLSASTLAKIIDIDPSKSREIIEQLTQVSSHAQKQMRGLIAQLRPVELEGRSLEQAIQKWFPDYCRHNQLLGTIDVKLSEHISDALEHQLFMIVQEAMANVVKHADAKHVELTLQELNHLYVLQIIDDGQGFNNGKVQTNSYGLSTMRERAQKLGGEIEIFSKAGSGTRIKVQIPKFKNNDASK